MSKTRLTLKACAFVVLTLAFASAAQAQATRTWVSGVGDDANPCSRTAPCKTFAGAISKTFINGEIDALDPGGFGTLTITKSITLDGTGTLASVLASGSPAGLTVNLGAANANDPLRTVRVRNLSINGTGSSGTIGTRTGTRGINVSSLNTSPVTLYVEDTVISDFSSEGILFNPSGGDLIVRNSTIRNCGTKGIMMDSASAAIVHGSIDKSGLVGNQEGLRAETNARVSAFDTNISDNTLNGVAILTVGGTAEINLHHCLVAHNKQHGVTVDGSGGGAVARLNDTMVVNNTGVVGGIGLRTVNGGQILSALNNVVDGNTSNGTVSGPVGKQ
jgi:hypothetical protein